MPCVEDESERKSSLHIGWQMKTWDDAGADVLLRWPHCQMRVDIT